MDGQKCKNCHKSITNKYYKRCPYCGQRVAIHKVNLETIFEEFSNAFHIESNRLANTIRSMILRPGFTMLDYLEGGRRKYQSPISYFFLSILFYGLFVHYVLEPKDWYIGLLKTLNEYQLVLLLAGLSIIAWITAAIPKFNFFEVFVVFSFIYGTLLFVTPILILLQIPFIEKIKLLPKFWQYIISDLPSTALIFYFSISFFIAGRINWLRFCLSFIGGYLYYAYFIQTFQFNELKN